MKTVLIGILGAACAALIGCQSSAYPSSSSAPQRFELMGTQQRFATDLPPSNAAASTNAPFALTGTESQMPAIPNTGYQSRN